MDNHTAVNSYCHNQGNVLSFSLPQPGKHSFSPWLTRHDPVSWNITAQFKKIQIGWCGQSDENFEISLGKHDSVLRKAATPRHRLPTHCSLLLVLLCPPCAAVATAQPTTNTCISVHGCMCLVGNRQQPRNPAQRSKRKERPKFLIRWDKGTMGKCAYESNDSQIHSENKL